MIIYYYFCFSREDLQRLSIFDMVVQREIFKRITYSHIKNGFSVCGQHRNVADDLVAANSHYGLAYSTVDYELILKQCYLHIPQEEKDIMVAALPAAVNEIIAVGSLSDDFMNKHNIMKSSNTKAKDDLVLNRQYAQVLSHDEVVRKQLFYLLDRHLRTDPVERQKRVEEDKQIKLIAAYEKKQAEAHRKQREKDEISRAKEEANRKRQQEQEAERQRQQSLTKAQLAQEKKQKAANQKKAKEELNQIKDDKKIMKMEDSASRAYRDHEVYLTAVAIVRGHRAAKLLL